MHDYDEAFIRDIEEHPEDAGLRLIYADWLDERGDQRGTFLRLEAELARLPKGRKKHRGGLKERLRRLREGIDAGWLARLDRAAVENCGVEFAFRCPKQWERLKPTQDPAVRFCESCEQHVYHCGSVAEAQDHAWRGHCVAVDSRLERTKGDLEVYQMLLGRMPLPQTPGRRFREGQRVTVTDGTFAGMGGVVLRQDRRGGRITIRLPLMGQETLVELEEYQVEGE